MLWAASSWQKIGKYNQKAQGTSGLMGKISTSMCHGTGPVGTYFEGSGDGLAGKVLAEPKKPSSDLKSPCGKQGSASSACYATGIEVETGRSPGCGGYLA